MDPCIVLIEEAKQISNIAFEEMKESLINSGLDEQSAKDKAYSNILPKLQKEKSEKKKICHGIPMFRA
jgi:hypothetical protein